MKKANTRTIRVPWTNNERKIFGAFKWNAYVLGMYEDIFREINEKYGWQVQYGAKHILTVDKNWKKDIEPKDIEEFINRNKQLYDIFIDGISSCDLFIADITNYNPNVLVELGIAIQQNKNILIVTSQDIKDLPFDIRGLEAKKYQSKEELQQLIEREIKIYTEIKEQSFKPGRFISTKRYLHREKGLLTDKDAVKISRIPKLKNLRIRVKFKFIFSTNHDYDWFGVSLRTQGPWRYYSELVLVRYSGKTRSLTWPEQRKENDGKKIENFEPEKTHTLEILIDENRLIAWVDDELVIEDFDVIIENFGEVWIGCLDHRNRLDSPKTMKHPEIKDKDNYLIVEYSNVEILDLSTTANLF